MYHISTENLILIPLPSSHLRWLVEDRGKLEKALNLEHSPLDPDAGDNFLDDFKHNIINSILPGTEKNPDHFMWYTHWLMVHRGNKAIAGGLGVSGTPDEGGEVTLDFFTDKKYDGKDLATEAVREFLKWLFHHPRLKTVIVHTSEKNHQSYQVLENNGFTAMGRSDKGIRWLRKKT